jgi:hypothetical protein
MLHRVKQRLFVTVITFFWKETDDKAMTRVVATYVVVVPVITWLGF